MTTRHTPGPWEITLDARGALGHIRPATPELATPIATIHYADSGAPDADARLIAEAPEMLATLRTVRAKHCTLDNLDDDLIAAIDAIIARIDA